MTYDPSQLHAFARWAADDEHAAQAEVDTPADPEREFWDDYALRYCDPATGEVVYGEQP